MRKSRATRDIAGQHEFIRNSHYEPQRKAVQDATGIDFDKRSKTLRDVLWSTAVQHRNNSTKVFKNALSGRDPSKMSDEELIKAVYAERNRRTGGDLEKRYTWTL